jgi:hypothetical protein
MAYRFQNWQVYKDARSLRQEIKKIAKTFPPEERFILGDQVRRAVLSVGSCLGNFDIIPRKAYEI